MYYVIKIKIKKKEKVNKIKYDKSLTNTIDFDLIKYYYEVVK